MSLKSTRSPGPPNCSQPCSAGPSALKTVQLPHLSSAQCSWLPALVYAAGTPSTSRQWRHELGLSDKFRLFATHASNAMGRPIAFFLAVLTIMVWAVCGPYYHYSDTWQIMINTGTTIITFLMVFLLQATQSREARAFHLKLDELIRAKKSARNEFANVESAADEELRKLERESVRLRQVEQQRQQGAQHDNAKDG